MADEWDQFADFQAPSVSPPMNDPWLEFSDVEPQQQQVLSTLTVPPEEPLTWGQVGEQALENLPSSGMKFAEDISTAVTSPWETAKAVGNVALGAAYKLTPGVQPEEELADKIGKFYSERYGSLEGFKKALAKDPVGIVGDVATVLTGGGAAVAKLPGMAGKFGKLAATTGRAIDPLSLAAKPVAMTGRAIGRGVSDVIGGLGTHTGGESLRQAARAGFVGGETAEAFQSGMRGTADIESVLGEAKGALQQMRSDRGVAYRTGMADVTSDKTVLNFGKVEDIVLDAMEVGTYKGAIKNPSAVAAVDEIVSVVDDWGKRNPAEFHTPEGLDALKQRIGDIREGTDYGSASRLVVDKVYNKVKGLIKEQAPSYAKVMKDYEEASRLVNEIERAFSLGEKAMADTAMRKLQSLTRNNVSTNYGNRLALAQELEKTGASTFLPSLSGQALSSITPRGLGNVVAGTTALTGATTLNPAIVPLLAAQSPRLMGEAAFYGGKGGRLASNLMGKMPTTGARLGAYQTGRLQRLLENNQ